MPDAAVPVVVPVRPLGFRELLDLPFALIQAKANLFGAAVLLAVSTAETVVIAVTITVDVATDGSAPLWWTAVPTTVVAAFVARLLLSGFVTTAAVTVIGRQQVTSATAWAGTVARLGPFTLLQARQLLIGLGVVILSVPLLLTLPFGFAWLVVLRARSYPALPAVVAEGLGVSAAVRRAKSLADGAGWHLACVWLATYGVLVLLAAPLTSVPLTAVAFVDSGVWPGIVVTTLSILIVVICAVVVESCSRAVVYVDRTCRRDGVDIAVPVR